MCWLQLGDLVGISGVLTMLASNLHLKLTGELLIWGRAAALAACPPP
jgi:hypothetical protein